MGAGRPGTTSPYKKKRSGSLPVRSGLWWTSAALLKSGKIQRVDVKGCRSGMGGHGAVSWFPPAASTECQKICQKERIPITGHRPNIVGLSPSITGN